MEEKLVNYAVKYNDLKEPIETMKVLTLTESRAKEIVSKVKKHESLVQDRKEQNEKEKQERDLVKAKKIEHQAYLISYLVFNEYVEKGVFETTQDFEKMVHDFLFAKCEFNRMLAPSPFLSILERVL